MDEQEIYDEVEVSVPQGKIVSTDLVNRIALRLERTYQPPKRRSNQSPEEHAAMVVQHDEFPIVVELALAQGYNPLSKTFHYWKMDDKIQVDDHYGTLLNWAQGKQPFTYVTVELTTAEKKAMGLEEGDAVVRFTAVRRADHQARERLFKIVLDAAIAAGKDFDEALTIAETKADQKFSVQFDGICKFSEWHYKDSNSGQWKINYGATPKGWKPGVSRAEIRAIRGGIKKMLGIPMPEERRRLGLDVTQEQMAELAASVPMALLDQPAEVRERYMQLAANNQAQEVVRDSLPAGELHQIRQENVNLLRGRKDEPGIGDDYKQPTFTEGQVIEEEDPFPAGPPTVEAVSVPATEPGLVETAQELGGVAVAADAPPPDPRVYAVEEAKRIILTCGYKSEEAVGLAIKSLIDKLAPVDEQGNVTDKSNLTALTETELWNFTQYALRRAILNDVNLPPAVRFQRVPEIESSVKKPATIKEAGEFMHNLLKMMNTSNQKMKRLETNG